MKLGYNSVALFVLSTWLLLATYATAYAIRKRYPEPLVGKLMKPRAHRNHRGKERNVDGRPYWQTERYHKGKGKYLDLAQKGK